jgi:hypothetical protein
MAFTPWGYSRQLSGSGVKLESLMAGGAVLKGQPLVISGGKVVAQTGGEDSAKIKYIAAEAITSGNYGLVYPALPDSVFQAKVSAGTGNVGVQPTVITGGDMTLNCAMTTQKHVEIIGINPTDTTLVYVVSRGWLA